jgi:hypothetical protein
MSGANAATIGRKKSRTCSPVNGSAMKKLIGEAALTIK